MQNGGLQSGINRDDKYISPGGGRGRGRWTSAYIILIAGLRAVVCISRVTPSHGPAVTLCLQKPILIIPHKGQARIHSSSIMDYPPP